MLRPLALAFTLLATTTAVVAAPTPKFSFEQRSYSFKEGDGTGTIKVLRTGDLTAREEVRCTLPVTVINGEFLSFGPGESSKTVTFTIRSDNYYTGSISGVARLSARDPFFTNLQVWIDYDYVDFAILEDEPLPTILAPRNVSVVEGSSGTIDVPLHFTLSQPFGVYELGFVTLRGTATADDDFIRPVVFLDVPAFQNSFDVVIKVRGDNVAEPDETIVVDVKVGDAHSAATITILNDDLIGAPRTQQIERGGNGSFTLSTSAPIASSLHIFLTSSNPAIATVAPFIDIAAGATSTTFPIHAVSTGSATISAAIPLSSGGGALSSDVTVFVPSGLTFERSGIAMTLGTLTTAAVHLIPPPEVPVTLQLSNLRPAVAEIPFTFKVDTDGAGSFPVRAIGTGNTYVSITLPTEYGGGTAGFQVEVAQPTGLAITSLSNRNGPATGNQLVTLFGNSIKGRCSVTFGGVSGLNTALAANGSVATYTPPHAAGAVDVAIRCDTEEFSFASAYTYTAAAPRITSITPATGSTSGGTIVTVTGENLPRGRCGLWFGNAPATTLTNLQLTEISAVAPPGVAGATGVTLRCGSDVSTLNGAFVYSGDEPIAEIAGVNPSAAAPGERITIGGSRFRVNDMIWFGTLPAIDMTTAPNQHFVTVPASPAGPLTIAMRDAGGRSIAGPSFVVKPVLTTQLTSTPTIVTAGAEIVVNGAGFRSATAFVLGGVTLRPVAVASTYAILGVPRTMQPQKTTFAVTDASGAPLASRPMEVRLSGVAIDSVHPQCVSTDGGALVTINGSGFDPGAVVTFGIADGTSAVVRDANTIVVRAPASSGVSAATIVVTNPSLESGQLTNAFQYRWPDSECGTSKHRSMPH